MSVNVLVVDDSDVIRSMILKTLRLAEVPVASAYEAENGVEALSILADNWVDVVIADINMPVMDGIEMLKRIRASEDLRDLPVIVVSTEGAMGRVSELTQAGVSAYVYKPFTPEKIRDVIDGLAHDLALENRENVLPDLQSTFLSVLEQFVFLGASPGGADMPEPGQLDGELLEARMSFAGPERGSMTLVAPFALAREMAANALGVDVSDPEAIATAADALGEVLNMTCGLFVMGREPEEPTDLTPPSVAGMHRSKWRDLASLPSTLRFVVEGRPALLQCTVRGGR